MVALGSSPLDHGHLFTDVTVKPSSRRKKNRFYKFNNSTNTWLHREVSWDEGFVVLTFLLSLEEAGVEGLGGTGLCPSPTGGTRGARHGQVPAAWPLPGLRGTGCPGGHSRQRC